MSKLDRNLLRRVLSRQQGQQKEAYVPPTPVQPPMDPAMMGGAMPPMDPSMMGGMPPMDPAMMGGAPPMDPAAMGGMPPMDPAMMAAMAGGAPPMDPSAMMGAPAQAHGPAPTPDMVGSLPPEPAEPSPADFAADPAEAPEADNRVTNKELNERIDGLENMLAALLNGMGIQIPETPTMLEEAPVEEPPAEMLPEASGQMPDEAFSLMAPPAQEMPAPMGMQDTASMPPVPTPEMGKTASDMHFVLANYLEQLRRYS